MNSIKRLLRITVFFAKLFIAYTFAFFLKIFNHQLRNVWIISERGDDARDNAYFFFRYMVSKHPEQPIWYVIKSNSPDFQRIRSIGNWIEYNSFKHYIYYALSKVRISSSMWGGDLPNTDYFRKIRKYMSHKRKFIFLKHGIIKDYLPQHCYGAGYPDLYICGAKPEYEYVKDNFGYPERTVQYLGLARFDNLHNVETKPKILIMPTFRKWLQGTSRDEIAESVYVKTWNAVLCNEKLIQCLVDNELEIVFYPHYVMQKYVDLFSTPSSAIKIAKFKDYDVQQLLIESKLLITDYSSVFFDFGYMGKPVIYFQFDREKYIKEHYDFTKGYFSYDNNGFGDVVFDSKSLIDAIIATVCNQFEVSLKYNERINKFFPLSDKKNCERIFNRIEEMISEKL